MVTVHYSLWAKCTQLWPFKFPNITWNCFSINWWMLFVLMQDYNSKVRNWNCEPPGNCPPSPASVCASTNSKRSSVKTKSTSLCKTETLSASGIKKQPAARSKKSDTTSDVTKPTRARSSKSKSEVDSCAESLSKISLQSSGKGAKSKANGSTVGSTKTATKQPKTVNSKSSFITGTIQNVAVRWEESKLVADITFLKTRAVKTIPLTFYYQELQVFFRSNGDAISNYKSKEKLKNYLEEKKTLRIELDSNSKVIQILSGNWK